MNLEWFHYVPCSFLHLSLIAFCSFGWSILSPVCQAPYKTKWWRERNQRGFCLHGVKAIGGCDFAQIAAMMKSHQVNTALRNKQHYGGSGELELCSESNQGSLEDFKQCGDIIRSDEDWRKLWNGVLAFHLAWEVRDCIFLAGERVGEIHCRKKNHESKDLNVAKQDSGG